MGALKFKTLGDVRFRVDRRGELYLDGGKVKRSKDKFYYEVATSIRGDHWRHNSNKFDSHKSAMEYVKSLA